MDRKTFFKKSASKLGAIIAVPTILSACDVEKTMVDDPDIPGECAVTPTEDAGPFPIKTPADWIRENIVGDRAGIPLMMTFQVKNTNNDCAPLPDVTVDIWQCDAQGNYSEYSGQQDGNFTNQHFLRGRQTTDVNGNASFVSIYPGWYPGRAPHLHLEVKNSAGGSLLVTQIAFPEDISNTVYATDDYNGAFDTSNSQDFAFRDGVSGNLADTVTGNITDGFTLVDEIFVAG